MAKSQKSAGASRKADNGNVTVDLGEKHSQKIERMISEKFAKAGLAGSKRTEMGRPVAGKFSSRPGLLGGGYRPWYSRSGGPSIGSRLGRPGSSLGSRFGRRPWLGQEAMAWVPGTSAFQIIPASLRQVATGNLLTGLGLGLLGNRALVRLTPQLWPNPNRLMHEGIAFAAGLIPMLFQRNAATLGVALPGAVYFGGTLVDRLFTWIGIPSATLAGAQNENSAGANAALAARQKLAAIQNRIQSPAVQPNRGVPRVVAQQYS